MTRRIAPALILSLVLPLTGWIPPASGASLPAQSAAEPMFASRTTIVATNVDPATGEGFTIKGQVLLAGEDGQWAPMPDQEVIIDKRFPGSKSWHRVATVRTADTRRAMFKLNQTARRNVIYRARHEGMGSPEFQVVGPSAAGVAVRVHRHIAIRLRQPSPGDFRLSGRVWPAYAHRPLDVLRRTCKSCAWTHHQTRETDERGRFSFRLSGPTTTSHWFVIRARRSGRYVTSYSQLARIDVGR